MKTNFKGPQVPVVDKELWIRFVGVCSALHIGRRAVAADLLTAAIKEWLDKTEVDVAEWRKRITGTDEKPVENYKLWYDHSSSC